MDEDKYQRLISSMNEEQLQAVGAGDGAFALLGGPGSGKTRCVVGRIARLIHDDYPPENILAMTFTRAAAWEMNNRLEDLGIKGCRVGTIHSVCRQIVAAETGLMQLYRVDDRNQMPYEVRKMLWDYNRDRSFPRRGVDRGGIERFISACKATGVVHIEGDPFDLNHLATEDIARTAKEWMAQAGLSQQWLVRVFEEMERRRTTRGLCDFDDMLSWCWHLLISSPDVRQRWGRRWGVVIIDEAQDNVPVQWDVGVMLTGRPSALKPEFAGDLDWKTSLMMVGDVAQSVYGFRHADPHIFLDYIHDESVEVMRLPRNYRAGRLLCNAATSFAKDKDWNPLGELISHRDSEGELAVKGYPSPAVEAEEVVARCMEIAEDQGFGACAVLARLNVSLDLVEIACVRNRVPYIRSSGNSFTSSAEARDVLGYLRVAGGWDMKGEHLRRIINRPFRYFSKKLLAEAEAVASVQNVSLIDAMKLLQSGMSYGQARELDKLYDLLRDMSRQISDGIAGPAMLIGQVLDGTDYIEYMRRNDGLLDLDESKLACLGQLQHVAREFVSTRDFIVYIDALSVALEQAQRTGLKRRQAKDAVSLSTIHAAKGLEFKHVFMVDVVQGRFPCTKSKDQPEEDRLFYVGLTRAEDCCTVSYTIPAADEIPSVYVRRVCEHLGLKPESKEEPEPLKEESKNPEPPPTNRGGDQWLRVHKLLEN